MDEQIMSWATSRPEVSKTDDVLRMVQCVGLFLKVLSHPPQDWHLGGKCDVFLWGAGRHGQLAEAGRNVLIPVSAPSFSQAQQVNSGQLSAQFSSLSVTRRLQLWPGTPPVPGLPVPPLAAAPAVFLGAH